jgi:hypothetical protein
VDILRWNLLNYFPLMYRDRLREGINPLMEITVGIKTYN